MDETGTGFSQSNVAGPAIGHERPFRRGNGGIKVARLDFFGKIPPKFEH